MTLSRLPQPADQEMAELAAAVYDNNKQQVGRWTRVYDPALKLLPAGTEPAAKPDPTSGFKAAVYSDGERHVLAFAGSERETRDWLTNLGQAIGLDTAQYGQAACFAKDCKLAFPDLTMTGHSLGGGLAAYAAAVSNSPAVTFNPAGVHDKTFKRAGVNPDRFREAAEEGLIRKYVVKGEILDRVQSFLPAPAAPGARIELEAPGKNTFNKHRIGVVIDGIEAKLKVQGLANPENAIGKPSNAKELADTFRSKDAKEGLKAHPGLQNAYQMLGVMEAKAATMGPAAGETFRVMARENIASRIERGDKIPPVPMKDRAEPARPIATPSRTVNSGPER